MKLRLHESENGYGTYDEFKSTITDELEGWGFEYTDDCHWDYFMPFGFYATYNAREGYAGISWTRDGNLIDISEYTIWHLDNPNQADKFGQMCYNFAEYDMNTLLEKGLLLSGAKEIGRDIFEYRDGYGQTLIVDLNKGEGDITYSDGDTEHFDYLQDLFSESDLAP